MYWLLKSEPSCWSWEDQLRERTTKWDGVRNYQARNNLMRMAINDLCFFYHSATKEPAIMGIVKVTQLYTPEEGAPNFGYVVVDVVGSLKRPVSLKKIKAEPLLADLALVRQSRLSVMPVSEMEWEILTALSERLNAI